MRISGLFLAHLEPLIGLPDELRELCCTHSEHPEDGGALLFSMPFKVALPTTVQLTDEGREMGEDWMGGFEGPCLELKYIILPTLH